MSVSLLTAPVLRDKATRLLVTAYEAAQMLSFSQRTLYSVTQPRGDLPVIKINGRSIRYSAEDLQAWIDSRRDAGGDDQVETETDPT